MESYDLINALNISKSVAKHLILEKRKPLGIENMHGVLHAIKNKVQLEFTYEKYWGEQEVSKRIVCPLALKEARYRWYIIALDTKDNRIKTFGLDRVTDFEISKIKFRCPKDYNAEKAFADSFGIINGNGAKPQTIVLSFTPEQGKYVKSLPLHPSQKELVSNESEYRIQLTMHATYDFEMELLSLGNQVKVLEPLSLQNEIKRRLTEAIERY
jgi:predicted DNA-binding transcriptional regulator YafY